MNPEKTGRGLIQIGALGAVAILALPLVARAANLSTNNNTTTAAIPWSQIGAKAGADYHGDGLAVTPTASGARLHCAFQRLDGEATGEGLWLTSTVTNSVADRFRVKATMVGRVGSVRTVGASERETVGAWKRGGASTLASELRLADSGAVSINGQTVRFTRPGLVEEYSVSMDGVRQDFIVQSEECKVKNGAAGELVVTLSVSGARVEAMGSGAQLVLEKSGRRIAYSRLHATDATGKELTARVHVCESTDSAGILANSDPESKIKNQKSQVS